MGVGEIAAVGTKAPLPQCGQRAHSARSMRRMKATTDSTITGSGGDVAREPATEYRAAA